MQSERTLYSCQSISNKNGGMCRIADHLTSDLYRDNATRRALRLSVFKRNSFKRLNSKTILSGVGEEQECAP